MSIVSSFGSLITKKRIASVTLTVFVSHIFSPFFAYAMSGDPTWSENILSTETPAIIQLNSVPLPRTLVAGDTITLDLSGSVAANPSATFITDEDTTLANLVTAINAVATGSIIASIQTGTGKSVVINASIPGVIVGTLTISRNLTERNIRNAVTAVAQQALVSLPQQLFASDSVSLTLAGSGTPGGVGLTQTFDTDSATTRAALASQINALSFVDATMTGATDILITSSFSGTPFSLSNVSVVSSSLPVVPLVANVPAQAQKEIYNLSRPTYSDETLSATVAGFTMTGSDLTTLSSTINTTLTGIVTASLSGASSLLMTAVVPGIPFAIGNLTITGGTVLVLPLIPNRVAVAQVNQIILPRSMVAGDTLSATVAVPSVVLSKTFTGTTLAGLSANMSTDSQIGLYVSGAVSLNTLTITSRIPGTAFTISGVHIDSLIASVNVNPNISAVAKVDRITFPRSLVTGDSVSLTINGNTVTKTFSGTSSATLTDLATSISGATVGVGAVSSGLQITVSSTVAGQDFTLSDVTLENSNQATVLVAPIVPVKQKNTYSFNASELIGDVFSTTINSTTITGSTLTGVVDAINSANLGVDASRVGQSIEVLAHTGGISFTASDMNLVSLDFTGTSVLSGGTTQVDTITIPRTLVDGDVFALSISGVLISQNITTATGTDLDNFVNILNLIENISAIRSGDTLTLTAKTPGIPFTLDFGRLTHLTQSVLSVSNDAGRVESQNLNFPAYIGNGDNLSFGIDGTTLTGIFNTNVATTFASIIGTSPISGIVFSASGANDLVITSTIPGALFQVNSLSIVSGFSPATLTGNVVAGYQKDTLTLPFDPISGDVISVTVIGTTQSGTFTRTFAGDLPTTMGLLASDISTLTGLVSASLDGTSKIFTLDAVTAGNGFTAAFNIGGTTIAPTTLVENTGALAQIDQINLGRTIATGDTLSVTVNSGSFVRAFAVDQDTTMNTLASDITTTLAGVVSASYAGGILTLTSQIAGTPFTTSSLTIATTVASANVQPNIVPVAQKDFINFERDPMTGDVFSFVFSGSTIQTLSGATLTGLVNSANLSLTGVANLSMSGTNAVEVLSSVPGIPFTLSSAVRMNSPVYSESYTPNIVSVFPIREIDLPVATAGDILTVTIDNGTAFTATGFDLSSLQASLNTSGKVTATLSGSITLSLLGTLDIPFTITTANVVNSTTVTLNQAFVPAVSRSVELVPQVTAPATTLNAGWTMVLNFNGANFSYLTNSGDTLDTVVNALYAQIMLTGSSAGTGITFLPSASGGVLVSTGVSSTGATIGLPMIAAISQTPGLGFTESFSVQDITAPILSSSLVQTPQTLRSGQTLSITGTVQANEPGSIYFISSALTPLNAAQILTAVGSGQAFLGAQNMAGDVVLPASLVVPALTTDGLYNIIAVDRANNLSMAMVGWLTIDNTAPILSIVTPNNQIVNQDTFTLSGTTEANISVDIFLGTGTINTTSLGDGTWSGTLALPQNTGSVATITATDAVGNSTTQSINITEDSGIPPLSFSVSALITNMANVTLSGTTKSGATVTVSGGSGSVSVVADGSGSFTTPVSLNLDANNILIVDVVDLALNTNSGTVSVLQDSTAPTVVIATLPQTVNAPAITLDGTTENNSTLVVMNGLTIVGTGTASATGVWNISSTLAQNAVNSLTVTATDVAGNTGSSSVVITEDSTPNTLVISTPAQTLNANTLTITGTTKPNSAIDISGGAATATGVADGAGLYSLVVSLTQDANNTIVVTSTDVVLNILSGSVLIVEDSTNPTTVIGTSTQTTYNPIITLTGTTEAFASVVVTGGSGSASTVSDALGNWTVPVSLSLSSVNTLVATATDLAGNTANASVNITHDSVVIFLTMSVPNQTVNAATFTFTGTTKSGATVFLQVNTGSVTSLVAGATGDFTGTVNLAQDAVNTIFVAAQDATLAFATGSFVITEDSTVPVLAFSSPSGTTVNLANIVLDGTTEALASISVDNSGAITLGTATATGVFSLTIPLNSNALNILNVTATDAVGNIGTGSWTVIQDSLGPVISGLSVTPMLAGPAMLANYTFTTNENSTGVLSIGTGANVAATLVATGATFGTTHTSLISGLLANTDYYYVVTTTDSVGNSTSSTVGVINSTDTVPPTIVDVTLSELGTTGASLDFTFTETNFNTTFATGSITITTSTGVVVGTYPTTFSSGVVSVGATDLSGLISGTDYVYTISITDTYGNTSTATGTFTTPTVVPLVGGVVTVTGSVSIGVGGSGTTALSGTTITVTSNPNNIDSLTGSLTISGVTSVVSSSGGWNGVLLSPILVASNLPEAAVNADITALVSALSSTTTTYSIGQIFQTVKVGAEGVSITAIGGNFQVSFVTPSASVGQTLRVYRSSDGVVWQNNTPDGTCTLDAQKMCSFRSDSLSYFAVASIIGTSVSVFSGGGGGGGVSLMKDFCPTGDYSSSYYDGKCGVKPTTSPTSTVTGTGKQNVTFTNDISSVINTDGTVSAEKLDRFVRDVQYKVYTRTLNNSARIMSFSSMNRYIDAQVKGATDTTKKAVLATLKNRFSRIIISLRQDIANGVTMIPNRKKNNTSSLVTVNATGNARIYRYVNTENILKVRSEPNFKSDTAGYLLMNERVELLATGPNWSQVKANTVEGYVRTRLLRKTLELRNRDASLVYASVSTGDRGMNEGKDME